MLKLLCFSDLHSNEQALTKVIETLRNNDFDACIACGDLTNFGGYVEAKHIVGMLESVHIPLYFVHGNCDTPQALQAMQESPGYMHGKIVKNDDYSLIGYGNVPPTPFATDNEVSEDAIEQDLVKLTKNSRLNSGQTIFISHSPPFGINDQPRSGISTGSKAIRSFIEKIQPALVLSGHIHEARGYTAYDYATKRIVEQQAFLDVSKKITIPRKENQGIAINVAVAKLNKIVLISISKKDTRIDSREIK